MSQTRVVHVDIQGQRYAIRSALDPKYVADIAAYVDSRMDLAGREIASTDLARVAVVAALNIVDDLFRTRQESADGRAQARALEIERIIDAVLDPPAPTSRAAR
ncbi:MAG TPA: cell division protein ZapA [Vicinamibacterales bacterium]|nr:cell division protein ZapA [Vicinamibacterales bacterium]